MQLTDAQRLDWLRLIRTDGVGPRTFRGLINRFGSASAALDALPDLTKRAGKRAVPPTKAEAEREMAAAARLGIRFLAMGEAAYPKALHATDTAPPLIAVRGDPATFLKPSVAIVGSRNASTAGLAFTERLARGFGEVGLVVVSGLARGIDARAHKATLVTGTVAVLAGGQDRIYPENHANLVEEIVGAGGAVVAEMPMGWVPRGRDFPRRNRIISGLSLGTVVVEAARRSGSLITARFALEQGREVFAVPGSPLDPRAEGTNDLIRQGATLVSEVEHVLSVLDPLIAGDAPQAEGLNDRFESWGTPDYWDEIDFDGRAEIALPLFPAAAEPVEAPPEPSDDRARLIACLSPTPVGTDELSRSTGLPVRIVQTTLLELELDGQIERHGSGTVSLVSRA
ncbi:DNA processing protein DprA [Methylobacterium sp. Leaf123]|uniref:DNA-processing protein DprA n=1 Tax=Methylobacterium sp. Leaf123 TaxID=1736264 RepID=UPI0006F7D03D|nr:DNA-processing protein DprA [Methylobacterium sp. Leaf123]KQQ13058.1 DNA processing protein DprA [Methylobacterium sp. Leaf123]